MFSNGKKTIPMLSFKRQTRTWLKEAERRRLKHLPLQAQSSSYKNTFRIQYLITSAIQIHSVFGSSSKRNIFQVKSFQIFQNATYFKFTKIEYSWRQNYKSWCKILYKTGSRAILINDHSLFLFRLIDFMHIFAIYRFVWS